MSSMIGSRSRSSRADHADDPREDPDHQSQAGRACEQQDSFGTHKDPAAHDDPDDDPDTVEEAKLSLQLGVLLLLQHLRPLLHLLHLLPSHHTPTQPHFKEFKPPESL